MSDPSDLPVLQDPTARGRMRAPPGSRAVHLCVDMQRLFSTEGPWPTPWMERVLPVVMRLAEAAQDRNVFTRFIPPERPSDMTGAWRHFYENWPQVTRAVLPAEMLELMPALAPFSARGLVHDKPVYSAFADDRLAAELLGRGVDTLIVSGAETDMCVLATVLGAVDRGFRVIVVRDAVCSSSDEGHDMLLTVYRNRFSHQVEIAELEEILRVWQPG